MANSASLDDAGILAVRPLNSAAIRNIELIFPVRDCAQDHQVSEALLLRESRQAIAKLVSHLQENWRQR
jgi:hypothetical protein